MKWAGISLIVFLFGFFAGSILTHPTGAIEAIKDPWEAIQLLAFRVAGLEERVKQIEEHLGVDQQTEVPTIGASRLNPAPFGNPVVYKEREVTVLRVEKIEQIVAKENGEGIYRYMPDGEGYYLIITIQIKNLGSPDKVSYYSTREFRVVGSKGKIYPFEGDPLLCDRLLKFIGGNELFDGEFFGGYTRTGRILRPVDADDGDLVLIWEPEKGVFCYLSLS